MTKIGWDSDGVLYRFTKAYHSWMNLSHGMTLDVESEVDSWDWFLEWQSLDDFKNCMDDAVDAGYLFWQGELFDPDIPQYLATLKSAGHENHLVTHRFSGKQKCSKAATEHFYASHGIVFDSITYTRDKASVKTDVFIEDNLDNYDALEQAGIKAYLVNRPYNMRNDNRRRVESVKQFVDTLLS